MTSGISRPAGTVRPSGLIEVGILLLVAGLAAHQLLVPPIVGVADQGDYVRVMQPLGLAHVGTSYEDTVFLWVQPRYRVVPGDTSRLLLSAELIFAGIARGLGAALSRDGLFDLRLLGGVHLAFYLAAVWLVLRAARGLPGAARGVVWLAVLLIAPDVAYIAYLNSFYSEPAAVICLIALLGVALGEVRAEAPSRRGLWAYFVAAALFAATKAQNYVLALPMIALPVTLLAARRWRSWSATVVPLAVVCLLWTVVLFAHLPDYLRYPAKWNGVFHGLLVDSPSPAEDLAEFGLGPEWARWTGVDAIQVEGAWVRAPIMEEGGRFSFRQIAWFYLRHPGRLAQVAQRCAQRAFIWHNPLLGNYTRDSGKPPSTRAPSYTGWSDLENTLFPKRFWFLATFFGLLLGVVAWELRRGLESPAARTALLGLTVATMAVLAFSVLVVAGGTEDAITDLYMFQVLFDVCLVFAAAWFATRFARLLPDPSRGGASHPVTPAPR